MDIESNTSEETRRIARQLGRDARAGDIYCLEGALGAGKTAFAKGFAEGLGIDGHITSPTFTIVNEYQNQGRLPLYHFDMYRIVDGEALYDTGYEDYFYGGGVCLIEWASQVKGVIPPEAVWITIEKDFSRGDSYRKITIKKCSPDT